VVDRGLINPARGKALLASEKGIAGDWFFNLVNHFECSSDLCSLD
jgi:hypothetical protein